MPIIRDITRKGRNEDFDNSLVASKGRSSFEINDEEPITTHVQQALDLLLEQFEGSPILHGFVRVVVSEIQELEYVLRDLKVDRSLNTAYGKQLDVIGNLVGAYRNFRNDNDYRRFIKFTIFANKSGGEIPTLISALETIAGATTIYIKEKPNTALLIETSTNPTPSDLYRTIKNLMSGGVGLDLSVISSTGIFGFENDISTLGFDEGDFAENIT
jgi:hypothetical protein